MEQWKGVVGSKLGFCYHKEIRCKWRFNKSNNRR